MELSCQIVAAGAGVAKHSAQDPSLVAVLGEDLRWRQDNVFRRLQRIRNALEKHQVKKISPQIGTAFKLHCENYKMQVKIVHV